MDQTGSESRENRKLHLSLLQARYSDRCREGDTGIVRKRNYWSPTATSKPKPASRPYDSPGIRKRQSGIVRGFSGSASCLITAQRAFSETCVPGGVDAVATRTRYHLASSISTLKQDENVLNSALIKDRNTGINLDRREDTTNKQRVEILESLASSPIVPTNDIRTQRHHRRRTAILPTLHRTQTEHPTFYVVHSY